MSLDTRQPSPIWDAINLDLFVKVTLLTFLNPLFSMWVPILTLSQRYPTSSQPYKISIIYFLVTLLLSIIPFSSHLWTNRVWNSNPCHSKIKSDANDYEQPHLLSNSLIAKLFSGPILNWEAQIVVITGGSSGLGLILVETLAVMGVQVVVIDKKGYVGHWDDVHSYVCDLGDIKEIDRTVKKIQEEIGHPTILINNAGIVHGIVHGKCLIDLTAEEVKETFDINVLAQFALIKAFLPNMLEKKQGHIVTVSSVFGLSGVAQLADYSASKHALIGLHESLKYELRYRYKNPPIRLSIVLTARIHTPLFDSLPHPTSTSLIHFVAPTLDPHQVAKSIIAAIETDQSRRIVLPVVMRGLWILEAIPSWAKDFVFWVSGVHEAMIPYKKASLGEKHGKKDL